MKSSMTYTPPQGTIINHARFHLAIKNQLKQQMKTKIHKIKIKDGCAIVDYDEVSEEGKVTEVTKKCPYLVTDDFKNALDRFKAHLAKICDLKEAGWISDEDLSYEKETLETIKVTGIVISGSDESEGVVIIGQKEIGSKVLNLVSPFTKFTDDHEPYPHEHQLYEDAIHACYEAELYLFENKVAVQQLELFGKDTEDLD